MSDVWKMGWVDSKTQEKIYWAFVRPATDEELKPIKKEWEEYNDCQTEEDDKVLWDDWGDHEERDIMNVLEKAKTNDEFKKSVLMMELDNGAEGMVAFSSNRWDIPTFEEEDYELSDYSKLRILNLVSLGYLDGDIVNWLFRNKLMNELTDKGKISDEEFKLLNSL